jgi:pyruvate/2-oxoglutarate dehydrogenase complex dihydrolipoamide dehydrogenase (E3) component
MARDYDMVVIGGGAAGLTGAGMSAVLGARTALIEARTLGGDCTWHGCVPSKSLIRAAKLAHEMRTADRYGLAPGNFDHDFAAVMARVHSIRRHIYTEADAPPNFQKLGVEVISGRARFLEPHAVEVESDTGVRMLTSRSFIVATGSSPRVPRFESDASVPVLTSETLFEVERRPERLLVLGAGPIGIEMAQAFQRLGSAVVVMSRGGEILGRDDRELAGLLRGRLEAEGVRLMLGTEIVRIAQGAVYTAAGERIEADAVLAATGRKANVSLMNKEFPETEHRT